MNTSEDLSSFTDIASIMGISRATLYRRFDDVGIDRTCSYSRVSDRELDDEVRRIKHDHPNDGERLMMGHLVSRGVMCNDHAFVLLFTEHTPRTLQLGEV